MQKQIKFRKSPLAVGIIAALTSSALVNAQEGEGNAVPEVYQDPGQLEETVVFGKLRSAADDVFIERMESEVVADFLDAETIGRIGDANVAAALRRVPGVTLVNDKYVFIRGLGERYSNSLLNQAQIPSPDLTRNVIPLDIFPTTILKSVAVQKGYSANMPAAFSGGLVDIRTKGIPDEPTLVVEVGTGFNSESTGDALSYSGGNDDWMGSDDGTRRYPRELEQAVATYEGSLSPSSILSVINRGDGTRTIQEAEEINRQLATLLNRNVNVKDKDSSPDMNGELSIGNSYFFDNGFEFGALAAGSYKTNWRSVEWLSSSFGDPENIFTEREQTIKTVTISGNVNLGARWGDDHQVETTTLFLRNTEDRAYIENYYDSSILFSDGRGFRDYGARWEERELMVNQIRGTHRLGDETRDLVGFHALEFLNDLEFNWFYSDSEASTEIPNEMAVTYRTSVDTNTGEVLTQQLQASTTSGDFRFTDLQDEVENYGWELKLPILLSSFDIEVSGGYNYTTKARRYEQLEFGIGTPDISIAQDLNGLTSDVFSDENILDPANSFAINLSPNNGESYLAGVINDAAWGALDVTWEETWRLNLGLRYEDYSQVGLPWNPIAYSGCPVSTCDAEELKNTVFKDDDLYPAIALTYMTQDFWAEDFQLRFNYSETVVRPDLREITPSSYIDPLTDARVAGSADVTPSAVTNYDLRAEWFFANSDSLAVSLFYKEIEDPIEFFQAAAFEEALAMEIVNGDSSEVLGLEFEWLKNLGFVSDSLESFFVAGNATVLDSELIVGDGADAPTNDKRPLAGASDFAFNVQLGYDSLNGEHAAMLIYNVFDERLLFGGRLGTPDAYEQPFHSLDATYAYYPTEQLTVKFKIQNILDEEVTIEQQGVETYSRKPGTSMSLDLRWSF